MLRRWLSRLPLLGTAALLAAAPLAVRAQLPSSVAFFGDSFTDTGTGDAIALAVLGTDLTPTPPYATGRASNGLLWADYLAAALGHGANAQPFALFPTTGRNFAVGTARTGTQSAGPFHIGITDQASALPAALADPTGLYVILGGANDIADAAGLGSPAAQFLALNTAVNNLGDAITTLYDDGAREFLVPNVPNVGLTPLALGGPPGTSQLLGGLTQEFNMLLATKLAALGGSLSGSTILGLHLDTLFDNILLDAAHGGALYGLTNTTVPCLPPPFGAGVPCGNAVFADAEHPTTAAHQLIAEAAFRRVALGVDVAAIPEPATFVLVGGGLVLLGVARTSRRRG